METYPTQSKVAHDTPSSASHDTSVLDLGRTSVGVHLGKLELGLGTDTRGQRRVADDVAESLPVALSVLDTETRHQSSTTCPSQDLDGESGGAYL